MASPLTRTVSIASAKASQVVHSSGIVAPVASSTSVLTHMPMLARPMETV